MINETPNPPLNGTIHIESKLLKHVVSSAVEAETVGLYSNCQTAIPIRHILTALGHKQPPTPVKTDNSTACSFAKDILKARKSKS